MVFSEYKNDHGVNAFFRKYIQSFVPPWFSMKASEVSDSTGRDFLSPWSWAFEHLMQTTGTPYELGVVDRYRYNHRGDSLAGATSRIGEIYKSSFVQTIDWFAANGWVDAELAKEHALSICPLDFSLWEISTVPVPEWWPKGSHVTELRQVRDLLEWEDCQNLIKIEDRGNLMFGAEGAVLRPGNERSTVSTYFRIIPFAYGIRGSNLPAAELIARFLSRNFWQKAPSSKEPLSLFSPSFEGWMPFFHEPIVADDLLVVPLLSRMESNNTNIWQWWRGRDAPFFPADALVSEGRPAYDTTSWFYSNNSGVVCRMRDWKLGTLEVSNSNEYPPHGQFALADSKWLHEILELNECRLGYVFSMDVKHRKDEYSKAETLHLHSFLNLSSLIV